MTYHVPALLQHKAFWWGGAVTVVLIVTYWRVYRLYRQIGRRCRKCGRCQTKRINKIEVAKDAITSIFSWTDPINGDVQQNGFFRSLFQWLKLVTWKKPPGASWTEWFWKTKPRLTWWIRRVIKMTFSDCQCGWLQLVKVNRDPISMLHWWNINRRPNRHQLTHDQKLLSCMNLTLRKWSSLGHLNKDYPELDRPGVNLGREILELTEEIFGSGPQ